MKFFIVSCIVLSASLSSVSRADKVDFQAYVTAALKQRGFNPEAMVISDTIGSSSLNAVNATIGSAIDQPGETKNIDFLSNGLEFNCIATAIKNWGKDDPRTFVAVEKCTVSTSGSSLVEIVVQKIGNEIR